MKNTGSTVWALPRMSSCVLIFLYERATREHSQPERAEVFEGTGERGCELLCRG